MTFQNLKPNWLPDTVIETGTEHWLSHAVLQIGQTQMQLTDQPIDPRFLASKEIPCR